MEVEVLRVRNIPDSGVISIRAGNTRRQAQLSSLDRPLKFPTKPDDVTSFKIDVLDVLGTVRLPVDGPVRREYISEVEHVSGDAARAMEIVFAVREPGEDPDSGGHEDAADVRAASKASSYRSDTRMRSFSDIDANRDGYISKDEFEAARNGSKATWQIRRESNAKDYLSGHGLVQFMQYLMQSLMKDKPADPYAFLQKQVAMKAAQQHLLESGTEEQDVAQLLNKLNPEAPTVVTLDQLAQLEKDASEAGDLLRSDNAKLRETAAALQQEYKKLLDESNKLCENLAVEAQQQLSAPFRRNSKKADPIPGETPQLHAYREIALVQAEVSGLAKENSDLVAELAKVREAINATRVPGYSG